MKTEDNQQTADSSAPTCSPFRGMTMAELDAAIEEDERKMDAIFEHDEKLGYITIHAPNPYHPDELCSPYHIELNRIPDPEGLTHWLHHLTGKEWMTGELVHEFIQRVYDIKGWNLYRRNL